MNQKGSIALPLTIILIIAAGIGGYVIGQNQNVNNINLREKCAEHALKTFKRLDYQENEIVSNTNHYNQKLNKCFMEIHSSRIFGVGTNDSKIWTYKTLSDAYEGKIYADYSWHTEKDKKYWEVPPFTCFMYPDGNPNNMKVCASGNEFDAFVATYMEN